MAAKAQNVTKNFAPAVNIGANVEAIKQAQEAVLAILSAPHADEATKCCALNTLRNVCSVNNTVVSNCHFQSS